MGADIRPKNLEKIDNISNKLDYKLLLDSSAIIEAIEINLSDIINQGSVLEYLNYKTMSTPKNFIATSATLDRRGTTKIASHDDIKNKTQNKILTSKNINIFSNCQVINITKSNYNDFVQYYDPSSTTSIESINILYHNEYTKNVTIHGSIQFYINNNSNYFAIYLKNINMPRGGNSTGNCISTLTNNTNQTKTILKANFVNNYLLELAFHQQFIAGNSYFLTFSLNYNI